MADHNHHCHHQHPLSPRLLPCPSIVVRSSSFFPHFPLRSPLLPPSPSSPPTSTIFCLILCVVRRCHCLLLCCLPSPPQDHCHTGATLHRFPTLSALALSYIRLLHASAMDLMDTLLLCRSITNVQSGHCHRRHHRRRRCRRHHRRGSGVAAPVSTPPATAAASTAANVVVVFAPAPLPAALPLPSPSPSRSSGSSPCWRRHRSALKDSRPQ